MPTAKSLTIALLVSLLSVPALASPSFDQAKALYGQKKYPEALKLFQATSAKEPANLSAVLYMADCFRYLGKATSARWYYQWLVNTYPQSKEAASAQMSLSQINGAAMQAFSARQAESDAQEAAIQNAPKPRAPVDTTGIFRVVRAQGTRPECSKEFITSVKDAMKKCPPRVVDFVARTGCKICITPTLIDRNPELKNSRPRGYEQGHTYKNTPAMYDGTEVVVCQYAIRGEDEGQDFEPTSDPIASLRHEFGHALDHHLGMVSEDQEYRHIYYLDRARIEGGDRDTLSYYIQEHTDSGGPSECFAEACCILFGGATSEWRQKNHEAFQRCFPHVLDYVKKRVNKI